MTADDFIKFREARSAQQWNKAFPNLKSQPVKSQDCLIYGNVSAKRLEKIQEWAGEHLKTLREIFKLDEKKPIWKGRLAVFVLKNRLNFEEFGETATNRRVFPESHASLQVSDSFEDALLIIEDTGDKSDAETPTLEFTLIDQLTSAYLTASQDSYPEWLSLGLGLALAEKQAKPRDAYVEALRVTAYKSLSELKKPGDIFKEGVFFSSDQTRPVGFTVVAFLLKRSDGDRKFSEFLKSLRDGGAVGNSIRVVYKGDPEAVGRSYLSNFKIRRKPKR